MAILHDFVVSTQPRPPDGVKAFTWVLFLLGVEEFVELVDYFFSLLGFHILEGIAGAFGGHRIQ